MDIQGFQGHLVCIQGFQGFQGPADTMLVPFFYSIIRFLIVLFGSFFVHMINFRG